MREYAVARIIGRTEKDGKTEYVVRWHVYTSNKNTVEPPEDLRDHSIARHLPCIGRRATAGNAQTNEYRSEQCQYRTIRNRETCLKGADARNCRSDWPLGRKQKQELNDKI